MTLQLQNDSLDREIARSQRPSGDMESYRVESFAEWRALVGNRFGYLSLAAHQETFAGSLRSLNIDETELTEIVASAHSVRRLSSQIRPDEPKFVKITLQVEGQGRVTQDGRTAILAPGDIAIYDTSRPYTLDFTEDVRTLVMIFPRHRLGLMESRVGAITAVRLPGDTGIGMMISPFMREISSNLDQIGGVNGVRIVNSALTLITALLSEELNENNLATNESGSDDMEKYLRFIDAHLTDTELNTVIIARAHFISPRYLQYLFRAEGLTVSGYIRSSRLQGCRIDLLDPAQDAVTILQVAQRWGFVDGAHFSKVFKAAYGHGPREFRAAANTFDRPRVSRRPPA